MGCDIASCEPLADELLVVIEYNKQGSDAPPSDYTYSGDFGTPKKVDVVKSTPYNDGLEIRVNYYEDSDCSSDLKAEVRRTQGADLK